LRKVDSFISDNSDSFHSSIKNVEVFTKSLKDNSEKIDRIVATVDKSLAGVETLTGDGKNPGEISETLKSFRSVADDVDKKTLKQLEGLIADARRTLATFDRAVSNFDRNPSRIIFGGSSGGAAAPAAAPAAAGPRRAQ
jgi:phospholipid/cholesterol/gamma-HCH transport system substrate-binding protein